MNKKIGIDAGHGGTYTGTYSIDTQKDNLYEKHYALELAKLVEARLKEYGFDVVMTRTNDERPGDVTKRAKILAKAGCDYAVSIHFNGVTNPTANGCEVFCPYEATDGKIEAGYQKYLAKFFALRKPFARSNSSVDRNETFDKKLDTATGQFKAATALKADYFGFIRTGWEKGMHADLLEVCFLTNRTDFDVYKANKQGVADAIARAIVEGFGFEWHEEQKAELYRVGTAWQNGKCKNQIGAYKVLKNAIKACPDGYFVFNNEGKTVFRRFVQENRR